MRSAPHDTSELIDRIEKYLRTEGPGAEARELIERLSAIGEVGIFGGMVRDFARGKDEDFSSDIDIVVDVDAEKLNGIFEGFRVRRNRFGGYRLRKKEATFDVWTLSNTWAIKQGLVSASSLADLTKTTFFDWDAAVYVPRTHMLHCSEDYLERIHSGMVKINLEPNPNPLGAIARTLRLLLDWNVRLSPELKDFLLSKLDVYDERDVSKAQKVTIGHVYVRSDSVERLRHWLREPDLFDSTFRRERVRKSQKRTKSRKQRQSETT